MPSKFFPPDMLRIGLVAAVDCVAMACFGQEHAAASSASSPTFDPEVAALIDSLAATAAANPHDAAAHGALGLAYDASGMTNAASVAFERAAELDPVDPRWPDGLARMRVQAGDIEGAITAVDAALSLDASYAPAQHRRGTWLFDAGRMDEAENCFRVVLSLDPKSIAGRVGLARVHMQRGENTAAVAVLEEILNDGPGDAYVFQLLGNALRRSGRDDLAREAFARAANPREPEWPDPRRDERKRYEIGFAADLERAIALVAGSDVAEGVRILEGLRARKPVNVALLANLGAAYCKMGRVPEGIETLQAAVRERPEHFASLMNLSQALEATGRLADALEIAEHAARFQPELVHGHMRRGFVLMQLGRPAEALDSFATARRLDGRSVLSQFWCGAMRCELGRWAQAIADFEEVLAQEPRLVGANVQLARARAENGDLVGARDALAKAEALIPPPREVPAIRNRIEELERTVVGR